MITRIIQMLALSTMLFSWCSIPAPACCPAPRGGQPVVNANQTVIIIWDAANQMQHFIRQASFKAQADDFGFLVPTPTKPELDESGNDAFPLLRSMTEPARIRGSQSGGFIGCGCGSAPRAGLEAPPPVTVLEEKRVAGFDAVVLEAKSAADLANWLKEHDYAFSPAVQAWAKPYVDAGWKVTALKVAKDQKQPADLQVNAAALRLSFHTQQPLFPYREPDTSKDALALGAKDRLLRIYFLADGRYQGNLTKESPWTGKAAWAGKISSADRQRLLEKLKLPETTGPREWFLTEFEDPWPYRLAPADVYFAKDANQDGLERMPIYYGTSSWPTDVTAYALAAALVLPPLWRRLRRRAAP